MSDEQPASGGDGALSGPDLVRAALAQARAAARARGAAPAAPRRARPARSGAGSDSRDPMDLGSAMRRLLAERGWERPSAAAGLLSNWEQVVGPDLAGHCAATSLVDGELVVVAESSAWATQLRLLMGTLLTRVREHAGEGVVRRIVVKGPAQADWRHGARRVQGRGPRDTYG